MPELTLPAYKLIVPVGAIDVSKAFRIPRDLVLRRFQPVLGDGGADIIIHLLHRAGCKKSIRIEQWKRALFLCQINRGQIGGTGNFF